MTVPRHTDTAPLFKTGAICLASHTLGAACFTDDRLDAAGLPLAARKDPFIVGHYQED